MLLLFLVKFPVGSPLPGYVLPDSRTCCIPTARVEHINIPWSRTEQQWWLLVEYLSLFRCGSGVNAKMSSDAWRYCGSEFVDSLTKTAYKGWVSKTIVNRKVKYRRTKPYRSHEETVFSIVNSVSCTGIDMTWLTSGAESITKPSWLHHHPIGRNAQEYQWSTLIYMDYLKGEKSIYSIYYS